LDSDQTDDPPDEWDSTMVNKDYFFRTKPTPEELDKAKIYGSAGRYIKQQLAGGCLRSLRQRI
jgi:hypothetical protein